MSRGDKTQEYFLAARLFVRLFFLFVFSARSSLLARLSSETPKIPRAQRAKAG